MTPEQFVKFQEDMTKAMAVQVDISIEKSVNGGIRGMRADFENYVVLDMDWKNRQDAKWKDAQPSIDLGKNVRWGGLFVASLIGVGAGMVAIITGIIRFITWLKVK